MPPLPTASGDLFYELTGPAAAPVVVLSNSLGTSQAMWEAQVPALAARYRVLRYDARGHGQSVVSAGPYTIARLGQDVLALLDGLAIEKAYFCGLSLGGLVGQWLGVNAPGRLLKLALSNTAAKIGEAANWNARIAQVQQEGMNSLVEATAGRWFTAAFRESHPEAVQKILHQLRTTSPAGYGAACAAVRDADFRPVIHQLSVPTLVLTGAADPVTTEADAAFLAQHIPQAQLQVLQAAHLANVEAAPAFTAALLQFFGG